MYLITGAVVAIICFTPVGKVLQSDAFLFVSLAVIGLLFIIAGIMTLRIKRQKNGNNNIKERIDSVLAKKEEKEHE